MFTKEQNDRIIALSHRVQSGVAWDHSTGSDDGTPKHLRTGVNIALVETGAIGRLLVRKGLVTPGEYADAIIEGLEKEVAMYERRLREKLGSNVTLIMPDADGMAEPDGSDGMPH
jgi:hypothetical protein